jgi:hypothetical protein
MNPTDFSNVPLRASSIPHMLHWDLAYLWMLSRRWDFVPPEWRKRILAWRRLLRAFLAGHLTVTPHELEAHIEPYLNRYGITSLQLLKWQGKVVGLLSPVVLVRPLPDGEPRLPEVKAEEFPGARRALQLVIDSIKELRSGKAAELLEELDDSRPKVLPVLLEILEKEANDLGALEHGGRVRQVPHRLLMDIPYFGHEEPRLIDVSVYCREREAPGRRAFVPRCESCGALLTAGEASPAAVTGDDFVRVRCRRCGAENDIPLEKFFVWRRHRREECGRNTFVIWTDRGGFADAPPEAEFPPDAEVTGNVLKLCWNEADTLDSHNRWLSMRFDGDAAPASILNDVLYRGFIEFGGADAAIEGLPYRWDWLDAAKDPEKVETARQGGGILFRNLGVHGLPFRFSRLCGTQNRSFPSAGIAVYPGPEIHSGFTMRRVFLVGAPPGEVVLKARGKQLTSAGDVWETEKWPSRLAVETGDRKAGASFLLRHLPSEPAAATGSIFLGLDFGTTNSVLYFCRQDELGGLIKTKSHGFSPSDVRDLIHWVVKPPQVPPCCWFPPEHQLVPRWDEYLVPSALWVWQDNAVIRWNDQPPQTGAKAVSGFKWDEGLEDRSQLRVAYLRELLFWAIPVVLTRVKGPNTNAPVHLTMSFPLAFSHGQRLQMEMTLEELRYSVATRFGHEMKWYRVDESRAAMTATGEAEYGSLTLVADLGGRTLDVVLFRKMGHDEPEEILQVGSIDLGAETFLLKLAENNQETYWRYRDQIAAGNAAGVLGGNPTAARSLNRLHGLAFEFIRTMAAAHRVNSEDPVRIMLVGNGWRLRDGLARNLDPLSALMKWAEEQVRQIGQPGLAVTRDMVPHISSAKHYVAVGALKHSRKALDTAQTGHGAYEGSRLPAGRKIEFHGSGDEWDWHVLVGDAGTRLTDSARARQGKILIHRERYAPIHPAWKAQIEHFLANAPSEDQMREWLLGQFHESCLLKGPLQLLIENHWKHLI